MLALHSTDPLHAAAMQLSYKGVMGEHDLEQSEAT